MDNGKFHLIGQINGHDESPIRALAIGPFGDLITGSQDCMLKRWTVNDDGSYEPFGGNTNSIAHSHWITAITSLNPNVCPDLYPNGCIVTGCMDKCIRVFDGLTSELLVTLEGHEKGVISLSWLVQSAVVFEPGKLQLVSGSWDGSARIWDMQTTVCEHILSGHENGVNVLGIQSAPHLGFDLVVTTSTGESINSTPVNFQIRFWNATTGLEVKTGDGNKPLRITDHAGPIRSLCGISNATMFSFGDANSNGSGCFECTFMTSSNDGTIKVRKLQYGNLDGSSEAIALQSECTATLLHPSEPAGGCPFILHCITNHCDSGAASDQGVIITSGEDGSVLVWDSTSNSLIQALQHPSSVWCTTPLLRGENVGRESPGGTKRSADVMLSGHVGTETRFATAGHDGIVRIFSNQPIDRATAEQTALHTSFEEAVKEYLFKKNKGPSAEDIEKAPKWDDRAFPQNIGRSDQQVAVFNKDGTLIAAQWSAISATWIEIGVVTGSGDGGQLDGVTYEHIMPVEIETSGGLKTLKLGYNNGENPFIVAKRFVDSNGLDNTYVQEIADWILKKQDSGGNGGNMIDMAAADAGQPDLASQRVGGVAGVDSVFTGSAHFPIKVTCTYEDVPNKAQFAKLLTKIESLNADISIVDATLALTAEDLAGIAELVSVLQNTSRYHALDMFQYPAMKPIVAKVCDKWLCGDASSATVVPARIPFLFPGFDLLRMLSCHASGLALLTHRHNERAVAKAFSNGVNVLISAELSSEGIVAANTPTILCVLRCMCTAMKHSALQSLLMSVFASLSAGELGKFFECTAQYGTHTGYSMNIHSAACNLLYNLTLFNQTSLSVGNISPTGELMCQHTADTLVSLIRNIANCDNGTANNDIIYKVGSAVASINLFSKRAGCVMDMTAVADCVNKVQLKLITAGITDQNSFIFECYNDMKKMLGV